jgi:hypothetical protein
MGGNPDLVEHQLDRRFRRARRADEFIIQKIDEHIQGTTNPYVQVV